MINITIPTQFYLDFENTLDIQQEMCINRHMPWNRYSGHHRTKFNRANRRHATSWYHSSQFKQLQLSQSNWICRLARLLLPFILLASFLRSVRSLIEPTAKSCWLPTSSYTALGAWLDWICFRNHDDGGRRHHYWPSSKARGAPLSNPSHTIK